MRRESHCTKVHAFPRILPGAVSTTDLPIVRIKREAHILLLVKEL